MRGGNYKNPCLTMHQPWASLLVHGIKRIEGRSWPAPIRGRLWIHAASKIPDEATIKAMEEFYREIYAVDGITDIQFPQHYPISRLIGCVEIVGCVSGNELQNWEALPQGVRLEGQTDFCWLCEHPQKLIIPFEMRGYQGVYNLENKIYVAAARGLTPSGGPFTVKFPLPDPNDSFSLKPGSVVSTLQDKKLVEIEQVTSLTTAIAGARAAATQFSKKPQSPRIDNVGYCVTRSKSKGIKEDTDFIDNPVYDPSSTTDCTNTTRSKNKCTEISEEPCGASSTRVENDRKSSLNYNLESNKTSVARTREDVGGRRSAQGPARIMAAALRNLKPS